MEKSKEQERILEIENKIKALKAQKDAIEKRASEKERKQRTQRLIRAAATLEKITNFSTSQEFQALGEYITQSPETFEKVKLFVEKRAKEILKENTELKPK